MRVCDGSCRRLSRLCRQSREQTEPAQTLAAQANACARAGHAEWATLMQRAADALRDTGETCCGSADTQSET